MRLLLVGGSGFFGRHFARAAAGWEVLTASRTAGGMAAGGHALDLTDAAGVAAALARLRPDAVLHAAGVTAPAACAADPARAARVNVAGTAALAGSAARLGVPLLFLSSDLVFGEGEAGHHEAAPPAPATAYGRMKVAAEAAVEAAGGPWWILRLSKMYGWAGADAPGLVERMLAVLAAGRPLEAYADWRRCFLFVEDAVALARRILEGGAGSAGRILHLGGPALVSSAEVAGEAARVFGHPAELVRPVETPRAPAGEEVPRLLGLDSAATCRLYGLVPRTVREGLRAMRAAGR
jgi:dTDP-4-dehydrorhamnose reductase